MAEVAGLRKAVAGPVGDGDAVALEGSARPAPFAAAHEIVRRNKRDLTLVRTTPDLVYDRLIGTGAAKEPVFSRGGNPGVGSLQRFRDAVERGWTRPLGIEEHSRAGGMANRCAAGASSLPFAVLRGYVGTDLPKATSTIEPIRCPFAVEEAREATGWDLEVAEDPETTEPPGEGELRVLRDLKERTHASRNRV